MFKRFIALYKEIEKNIKHSIDRSILEVALINFRKAIKENDINRMNEIIESLELINSINKGENVDNELYDFFEGGQYEYKGITKC